MTVLEVIQRSADFLAGKGVDSPRLQAELLLAHVLKIARMRLYLDFERAVSESDLNAVRELVKRRGRREPLQQIVGSTSFVGLELFVTPDVLVPRPETEILAERAWQRAIRYAGEQQGKAVRVLDFGTGSGCLAISIAKHCPEAMVTALDCSPAALAVARTNATAHQLESRITFLQGDGFTALPEGERFEILVSNPPYIASGEIRDLQPEVRDFEPHTALDGGADGLDFYRHFATESPKLLEPGGTLLVEFGDGQAEAIRQLFDSEMWIVEAVLEDYTRRPRILIAQRR